MASFRDIVAGGKNEYGQREKGTKTLKKETPFVAEILAGSPAEGGNPEVSPGTIAFFMDGTQMKFSIFVKTPETKFFGVVQDPLNPWGSVNAALLLGDVSRKRHTEQVNGSPTHEDIKKLY